MLLAGMLTCALLALCPAQAQAQPAQVEALPPGFDMFDLDSLDDDGIALPSENAPTGVHVEPLDPLEVVVPQGVDSSDPCRHFTQDERRRLPALCGPSD